MNKMRFRQKLFPNSMANIKSHKPKSNAGTRLLLYTVVNKESTLRIIINSHGSGSKGG